MIALFRCRRIDYHVAGHQPWLESAAIARSSPPDWRFPLSSWQLRRFREFGADSPAQQAKRLAIALSITLTTLACVGNRLDRLGHAHVFPERDAGS